MLVDVVPAEGEVEDGRGGALESGSGSVVQKSRSGYLRVEKAGGSLPDWTNTSVNCRSKPSLTRSWYAQAGTAVPWGMGSEKLRRIKLWTLRLRERDALSEGDIRGVTSRLPDRPSQGLFSFMEANAEVHTAG